jgi:hypothetical protein
LVPWPTPKLCWPLNFWCLTRWRSGPPGPLPPNLPVFFLVAFSFVACARSFCCTDRVLLRFPCTYNRSADCVRSARTHHIPSHPIPSHHILYILVLELERTFFSSSFSHSIVGFFVSSDIWSFLMLSLPSRAVRRQ